jgi:CPA2 family monovalent cation:H+ antiporter-2
MLNPILYRLVSTIEAALLRQQSLWRRLNARRQSLDSALQGHAGTETDSTRTIVVGYGPVGQTLTRVLRDAEIEPVVIEMNLDTVRHLQKDGHRAVYGDAGKREVLEGAGIRNALGMVISGPAPDEAAEIIRIARQMNPKLQVLARAYYLSDTAAMREAGANHVFSGEGEVALAMTEHLLRQLGSSPEQIDRERQRIRDEVFLADKAG